MEPIYNEDYEGYRIKLFPEEYMEDPRKNMDFASTLVFESKSQILDRDDYYARDDRSVLEVILVNVDSDLAERLGNIVDWKSSKIFTHNYCYKESGTRAYKDNVKSFDDWKDELYRKYLDKLGVVYDDFSLMGSEHHRGYAYISPKKVQDEWKGDKDMALKCIPGEIEMLNQWIEGDVYYRTITQLVEPPLDSDDEDLIEGEEVDVVGRFYGYKHAIEDAHEEVDQIIRRKVLDQPALRVAREFELIK